MADRQCDKCGKQFQYPSALKAHSQRKTPCQPKVETTAGKYVCRHCGRGFAFDSTLSRHITQNCKLVKKTAVEPLDEVRKQTAALQEQNTLIKQQNALMASQLAESKQGHSSLTINTVNNVNTIVAQQIVIHPWGGNASLRVSGAMIAAAFAENSLLAEYCEMGEYDKSDDAKAKVYIFEALMELTRRAHQDPAYRNVYLNPNRADQAMVCVDEKWEVCPVNEATRIIFDSVSAEIRAALPLVVAKGDYEIPDNVRGSACYVPQLYRSNPKQYIDMAKAPIAAHLANIALKKLHP